MGSRKYVVELHTAQQEIWNSPARFKVAVAGRRFGKSHLAAHMLIVSAMLTENQYGYHLTAEHGVYYVAPTFDQAKRVMWPKLRALAGYAKQGGLIQRENVNDGWIELISGRRIYLKGADNPDSLRGIALSFVCLDEYADMKPFVWDEIIDPALMDVRGNVLFIGTPKPGARHFQSIFMMASGIKPGWVQEYIPEDWKDWAGFHYTSLDNPFISREELDRMMNTSNKPRDVIRQEIEAEFTSGGGNIISPKDFKIIQMLPGEHSVGQLVTTVDLAGLTETPGGRIDPYRDESVIVTTYVEDDTGDWFVHEMQHGQWGPRECALRMIKALKQPGQRLGIEQGALKQAVGPYLEDYMREFNRFVTPEPLMHFNARKLDRITWALQGRAERGKIHLVKGPWNQWFLDQIAALGDKYAHDDGPDALSYVDQMTNTVYHSDIELDEWEALDLDSGY